MHRFKFRPHHRLSEAGAFQSVFDENEIRVSTPEVLILAKRNDLQYARLGLVMRKKFVRMACDRNRIKRIFREAFRLRQPDLPGLDCVLMTRQGAHKLTRKELRRLIENAFDTLVRRTAELA